MWVSDWRTHTHTHTHTQRYKIRGRKSVVMKGTENKIWHSLVTQRITSDQKSLYILLRYRDFIPCQVLIFGAVRREIQDVTPICYPVTATLNLDAQDTITKHNKWVENVKCQMLTTLMCVLYFSWHIHVFCLKMNGHRNNAVFHVRVLLVRTSTITSYMYIKKKQGFGDWIDARSQAIECGGMASTLSEQTECVVLSQSSASWTVYVSSCGRFRIPDNGLSPET
jgi:hypothetical protein